MTCRPCRSKDILPYPPEVGLAFVDYGFVRSRVPSVARASVVVLCGSVELGGDGNRRARILGLLGSLDRCNGAVTGVPVLSGLRCAPVLSYPMAV
eukprot:3829107-Pyramimonas_sp.AAC.1